jgi:PTS system nitrogen regulatory IIA component
MRKKEGPPIRTRGAYIPVGQSIMQRSGKAATIETAPLQLSRLLRPERVAIRGGVSSKKRAVELISELMVAGQAALDQGDVFACLIERERLGSTGLGHGVALPHGRLRGLSEAMCAFLKLNEAIEFDAADGQPVDLVCGLLVPEASTGEHLDILAMLAEMFSDAEFCERLRRAKAPQEVYDLLVSRSQSGRGKTAY